MLCNTAVEFYQVDDCLKAYNLNPYLLPEEEKQSVKISSRASRRILKLGERETKQMHLSANEFAGMR